MIVSATMFALSSCLDEHPKDQLDEDKIYTTASDIYINAVASLYNYIGGCNESEGIQGTCRGIYDYNTLTTDEAIIPIRGGDWYDGGLWNAMYQHKWTATDEPLYDTWKYIYKVIALCNRSLDIIDDHYEGGSSTPVLSKVQRDEYNAEVRAIRALMYYEAMDMFGRVPLVKSTHETLAAQADVTHSAANNLPVQSKRSEVFWFVFNELNSVFPDLPAAKSNFEGEYYGRLTQPVAFFLMAKLALNAEIYTYDDWNHGYENRPRGKGIYFTVVGKRRNAWETCLYYCGRLSPYGYVLEPNYATNFSTHNETSRENIFTIPMDKNIYTNQFHYLFRSYHYSHGGVYGWGSENGTCATISTMRANHWGEYDMDNRAMTNFVAGEVWVDHKQVMMDNGKPLVYQPFEVKQNLTNSPYVKTAGARMKKYAVDRTSYMDGKLQSNDIVLFRYADVLLMEAEAKLRIGGHEGDGTSELYIVRERAGMPERQSTLDNILEERLLEFVWEGCRRQDLIRFGKFTGAYDLREPLPGEESGYTTVFPIPQKCLDLNKNLKQNPGYER